MSDAQEAIGALLDLSGGRDLAPADRAEVAEREMLKHEQVECPVHHIFGPGIYIREVRIPAGTLAIGHRQKQPHMNVLLQGRVTMLNDDGSTTELKAPLIYVGKPGRKIGYIHEDMVWQNIYATPETDVEALERTFLDKSEGWAANAAQMLGLARLEHEQDRQDYAKALEEYGFTEDVARAQSENAEDLVSGPVGVTKIMVGDSPIDGRGIFATAPIAEGETIYPARIDGRRTIAGRYTNHSSSPNAKMVMREGGDIDLVASRSISGCRGGANGEEITIDYREELALSVPRVKGITSCQQ